MLAAHALGEVLPIMTATEIEEIRKRWIRLRVCNVCSRSFQSSRKMRKHKANHHSYWELLNLYGLRGQRMTLLEFILILSVVAIPTIVYGWHDARRALHTWRNVGYVVHHSPLDFWQHYLINWIQASRGIYENAIKANEYCSKHSESLGLGQQENKKERSNK